MVNLAFLLPFELKVNGHGRCILSLKNLGEKSKSTAEICKLFPFLVLSLLGEVSKARVRFSDHGAWESFVVFETEQVGRAL